MATITLSNGNTEVINARRTESIDASCILQLSQPFTDELFGRVNVVNIIEKAVLSITLTNEEDEIIAHTALFDYPNMNNVDQAEWESWMSNQYRNMECSSLNSLFMHYFVACEGYAQGCIKEIVRTAFNAVPDLEYVLLVVPYGVSTGLWISDVFQPMERLTKTLLSRKETVFICHRTIHSPVLQIRKARIEDHDDLTPIFNQQSDVLKSTYGEYFLAELIDAQDEHMHALVAEVDGIAVGFMSISEDVNFDLLNECFELGPFHGLRKVHAEDVTTPVTSPVQPHFLAVDDDIIPHAVSQYSSIEHHEKCEKENVPEIQQSESMKTESSVSSTSSDNEESRSDCSETRVTPKISDAQLENSSLSVQSGASEEKVLDVHMSDDLIKQQQHDVLQDASFSSSTCLTPENLSLQKRFVPKYNGASNAFSIQLFGIDERFEMRSCDFLPKAFSLFPDFDFIVVTVPHLVPIFPLIQNFVRVTPRCPSILPQELYCFHRSGLLKDFVVRAACSRDYTFVEMLVRKIQLKDQILRDLVQFNKARRDSNGTEIQAFVAECQKQVVGFAIIRREEDIQYIRAHYNIEDFIYFNHHRREDHGHLHHFVLNPIFSHLTKHFLKEILRLGHKSSLYYPLYPSYASIETVKNHSLVCCLDAMVPVRARRQINYPVDSLGINAPSDRILAKRAAYALNHFNRKLTLEPKVTINARIVVVGASEVGLSFLETFAFCPHLRFNNLTLVSPHGFPGEMPPDFHRDHVLSTSLICDHEECAKVSLKTWVNVVCGYMTSIDRKKKIVFVNGNSKVSYDHLILCTGLQFMVPAEIMLAVDDGVDTTNSLSNSPLTDLSHKLPTNLFIINDSYDAAVTLFKAEKVMLQKQKPVIVYGNHINAYTCMQSLLSVGMSGCNIYFVQPATDECVFDDITVSESVKTALEEAGVKMYGHYHLLKWNIVLDFPTEIVTCTFASANETLCLECQALFAFIKKDVDAKTRKAINDSCLVYDGRLVIDSSFHTNDVSIRGAGPLTKYQRRYQADQWTHACFNSTEIGIALANEMLRLFDPTLEQQRASLSTETSNLLPIYRSPQVTRALLPGGYFYLRVFKPIIPNLSENFGQVQARQLSTGKPDEGDGYMKLGISQYDTVDNIVCLSRKCVLSSNLVCLFGQHQRALNNLLCRFDEGLIHNLFSFFSEPWNMAVFHDRFSDLREEIRELLLTRPGNEKESLDEKVRLVVDEEVPMTDSEVAGLKEACRSSGWRRAIETRLLSFLAYNYYHLPMYAKPGML